MRRMLAAAALAVPLFFACASTTTPGGSGGAVADAGPDDAARPADADACTLIAPYSSQNAPCNACAQAKCCAEINGCLGDPGCNDDYVNCAIACALDFDGGTDAGPTTCLSACEKQYPQGKAEYDVAIGCAEKAC